MAYRPINTNSPGKKPNIGNSGKTTSAPTKQDESKWTLWRIVKLCFVIVWIILIIRIITALNSIMELFDDIKNVGDFIKAIVDFFKNIF